MEVIVYLFHISTPPLYSFLSTAEARREKLTSATLPSIRAKTFYSQTSFCYSSQSNFVFQFLFLNGTVQKQYKYQMPPLRMDIILYALTGCAITSCTKIKDAINFELNTQNFLPPIVTVYHALCMQSQATTLIFNGLT